MEDNNTTKIAAVFLLGAIAGGVFALLYASKSGKETRKNISDEIGSYLGKAAIAKNKLIEKAKTLSNDMLGQTERIYNDVQSFREGKYSGTAEKIEKEISRLRSAIKAAIESYKDTKKIRQFFPDNDKYYFTDFGDYLFQNEEPTQIEYKSSTIQNK